MLFKGDNSNNIPVGVGGGGVVVVVGGGAVAEKSSNNVYHPYRFELLRIKQFIP